MGQVFPALVGDRSHARALQQRGARASKEASSEHREDRLPRLRQHDDPAGSRHGCRTISLRRACSHRHRPHSRHGRPAFASAPRIPRHDVQVGEDHEWASMHLRLRPRNASLARHPKPLSSIIRARRATLSQGGHSGSEYRESKRNSDNLYKLVPEVSPALESG